MFYNRRRTAPETTTVDQKSAKDGVELAQRAREAVFVALGARLGKDQEQLLRDDFAAHIEDNPVHGVDVAYACLIGKMVDLLDSLHDIVDDLEKGTSNAGNALSPFTIYRKDL